MYRNIIMISLLLNEWKSALLLALLRVILYVVNVRLQAI